MQGADFKGLVWFGESADANEILCVNEECLRAGVFAVKYLAALVCILTCYCMTTGHIPRASPSIERPLGSPYTWPDGNLGLPHSGLIQDAVWRLL